MSLQLSDRVNAIQPSATIAMNVKAKALAAEGISVINLSVGEPDFDTPTFIQEAAITAMQAGQTRYTAADGSPALKLAIAHKLERDNHLHYETQDILVTSGAKQALFNAMQALLNPNDEVIIPAPYWVSYPDMVILAGAKPKIVHAGIDQHYKISPEQLEAAITPNTRMLIMNSPSNPTGASYQENELQALAEVLMKHPKIVILSDDIYEYINFENTSFVNLINVCPALRDRSIIVNGVSKSHAMTGWRIGYAAGPSEALGAMKKLQSQSTSCANAIAQAAAVAALDATPDTFFQPMLEAYQARHQWLLEAINAIDGFEAIPAQGTFYLFVHVQQAIERLNLNDDLTFATLLLEKGHVATVPGSAFGSPGYLRLSFATSLEALKEAIKRIQHVIEG
ncbi:MAG: aspartate aminotransferase [Legionellales bacterium]|nr:aspartate aminotransferase [Legionellales bacterium]HAG62261.1 aspartate aminotransferase [Coxiellaceae bacterium]